MTKTEKAYAAGIIDADGSISIAKNKSAESRIGHFYVMRVNMACSSKAVIDWLLAKFGGSVYHCKKQRRGWKRLWRWQIANKQALACLLSIHPYMITKKERAGLAIAFQSRKVPGKHWYGRAKPEKEYKLEEGRYQLMAKHNKRGAN